MVRQALVLLPLGTQCFDPDWIRIQLGGQWIRAKMTHKYRKKLRNVMFWSLDVLFCGLKGLFCSLDVLYGGLGIGKLQFLIEKYVQKNFSCKFCSTLVIKTLDPDWTQIRNTDGKCHIYIFFTQLVIFVPILLPRHREASQKIRGKLPNTATREGSISTSSTTVAK
jgi:hypothetical protein